MTEKFRFKCGLVVECVIVVEDNMASTKNFFAGLDLLRPFVIKEYGVHAGHDVIFVGNFLPKERRYTARITRGSSQTWLVLG